MPLVVVDIDSDRSNGSIYDDFKYSVSQNTCLEYLSCKDIHPVAWICWCTASRASCFILDAIGLSPWTSLGHSLATRRVYGTPNPMTLLVLPEEEVHLYWSLLHSSSPGFAMSSIRMQLQELQYVVEGSAAVAIVLPVFFCC